MNRYWGRRFVIFLRIFLITACLMIVPTVHAVGASIQGSSVTWAKEILPVDDSTLYDVAWSSGQRCVAVGTNGSVLSTTDGHHWLHRGDVECHGMLLPGTTQQKAGVQPA